MKQIIAILLLTMFTSLAYTQPKRQMKKLEKEVEKAKAAHKASLEKNPMLPYTEIDAKLVPFHFINSKHELVSLNEIPSHEPIMLVFFNPMCDHCLDAAKEIKKHIQRFKNMTILYVTGINLLDELDAFKESAGVRDIPNFIVCGAKEEYTKQLFKGNGIPQFMFYNQKHILQHIDYKTFTVDTAMHYLQKQ